MPIQTRATFNKTFYFYMKIFLTLLFTYIFYGCSSYVSYPVLRSCVFGSPVIDCLVANSTMSWQDNEVELIILFFHFSLYFFIFNRTKNKKYWFSLNQNTFFFRTNMCVILESTFSLYFQLSIYEMMKAMTLRNFKNIECC